MNLDQLPQSPYGKRMLDSVSPIYNDSYVAKWLFEVMGLEIDEVWRLTDELRGQIFPETATWGLQYWEEAYSIPVDKSLPLDVRRARIKTRRGLSGPVNPARLEALAKQITGMDTELIENVAPYTAEMRFLAGGNKTGLLWDAVRKVKPSHISFRFVESFRSSPAKLFVGVVGRIGGSVHVNQYAPCAYQGDRGEFIPAVYTRAGMKLTVYAKEKEAEYA